MITAAVSFGPSLLSPLVLSMKASPSLNFECGPVTKSASIESTQPSIESSVVEHWEALDLTLFQGVKCVIPAQKAEENPDTMAIATNVASGRRVIFPSLHQQRKSSSSEVTKFSSSEPPMGPNFESRSKDLVNEILRDLLSPRGLGEAPWCPSAGSRDIPLLPRLGMISEEGTKIDLNSLVIPSFTPKARLSNQVQEGYQPGHAPVTDTPAYKKRVASPFLHSSHDIRMPQAPKLRGHPGVQSILRKKVDSVPSIVSMSSSESSLLDLPRKIAFDPRVWICEFHRDKAELTTTWYTPSEMDRFRRHAIERIHAYSDLVPTGTGRLVRTPLCSKAFFTHPALLGDDDEDLLAIQKVARSEIKNILVVDPHDLCAKLFVKAFERILPHAKVVTAKSSDEASRRIERSAKNSFDVIVVEERLKMVKDRDDHQGSGSELIRLLRKHEPEALFIGVSAHYAKDKQKLEEGGAVMTWPKPPPPSNSATRNEILKQVLLLRHKDQIAMKYFA